MLALAMSYGRVLVVNAVGGLKEILCNVQPFNPFDSIDVNKLGRTNGNKCCLMWLKCISKSGHALKVGVVIRVCVLGSCHVNSWASDYIGQY